jgi:hypothetical protein
MMRKTLLIASALAIALPGIAGAAARVTAVDTAGYPTVRATVVTPKPVKSITSLTENGQPVAGFEASNLGREKSVALVIDNSRSMRGKALADATAAARSFVRTKPRSDRIAIVAAGKKAVQLTGFSTSPIDADSALRTLEVDRVQGTALYDAVVLTAQALAADVHAARVGRTCRATRASRRLSPPPARRRSPSIRSRSRARASSRSRSSAWRSRPAAGTAARPRPAT